MPGRYPIDHMISPERTYYRTSPPDSPYDHHDDERGWESTPANEEATYVFMHGRENKETIRKYDARRNVMRTYSPPPAEADRRQEYVEDVWNELGKYDYDRHEVPNHYEPRSLYDRHQQSASFPMQAPTRIIPPTEDILYYKNLLNEARQEINDLKYTLKVKTTALREAQEELTALQTAGQADKIPKKIYVRIPNQPLVDGVYKLRHGEILNGSPVWGCDDKRLYSGSKEYWLLTDESTDMPLSRGYVQSAKQHGNQMPIFIRDWKVFNEGWELDKTVEITDIQGGGRDKLAPHMPTYSTPHPHYNSMNRSVSPAKISPPETQTLRGMPSIKVSQTEFDTRSHSKPSLRSSLSNGAILKKHSPRGASIEVFACMNEIDSMKYFCSRPKTSEKYDTRVPTRDIIGISVGPFTTTGFSRSESDITDPGLCFSLTTGGDIFNYEAFDQKTFLIFVIGLSIVCSKKIKSTGRLPLTTTETISATQSEVRKLWMASSGDVDDPNLRFHG